MVAGVRCGDPGDLCESLRHSPLLAVLRPASADQAHRQIEAVVHAGFRHVELAWNPQRWWSELLNDLSFHWPQVRFGVAGVRTCKQLQVVHSFGIGFVMSPISCREMWQQADLLGLTLVPGVFSPSEVHHAGARGPVKLFPAATLGPSFWRQLRGPMAPLPFCVAAGGITPADLGSWFAAGVEAVALGSSLLDSCDQLLEGHAELLEPYLADTTTNRETL